MNNELSKKNQSELDCKPRNRYKLVLYLQGLQEIGYMIIWWTKKNDKTNLGRENITVEKELRASGYLVALGEAPVNVTCFR